jgi:hypothetical protein
MNFSIFLILCGVIGMILYFLGTPLWLIILLGIVVGFLLKKDDDDNG